MTANRGQKLDPIRTQQAEKVNVVNKWSCTVMNYIYVLRNITNIITVISMVKENKSILFYSILFYSILILSYGNSRIH